MSLRLPSPLVRAPQSVEFFEIPYAKSEVSSVPGKSRGAGEGRAAAKLDLRGPSILSVGGISASWQVEREGGAAFEAGTDRFFSGYKRLYEKIDSRLDFPAWLRKKKESGRVSVALLFRDPPDGQFELRIRSDSAYLRVRVARLFRYWPELGESLRGLERAPIYLHFEFAEEGKPKLALERKVHNNRLFFRRSTEAAPSTIEFDQSKLGAYVKINAASWGANPEPDGEPDYRRDPAYREGEFVIFGKIPG